MKLNFKDFELIVPNLEKSLSFYKDTLGLPMRFRNETFADFDLGYGSRLALWTVEHASQTCGSEAVGAGGNRMLGAIRLKSREAVEAAFADLKQKKVNLVDSPRLWSWGEYGFHFKDLDGYLWEVYFQAGTHD